MPIPQPKYNRNILAILFICMVFVGLVTKRAVMSIGMISLAVSALVNSDIRENARRFVIFKLFPVEGFFANTFLNPEHPLYWKEFFSYRAFPVIMAFIFPVILSGIWSDDTLSYWKVLVLNSPFFFLPFAIGSLKPFTEKALSILLYVFILVMFVSSLSVIINYLMHFEEMNRAYLMGKVVPAPHKEHIRFSLMLVFSCIGAVHMLLKNRFLFHKAERYFQLLFALFFFVVIHILSVRSGLIALYVCLFYTAFYVVLFYRKYLLGSLVIILLFTSAVSAYKLMPSLKNKIAYMQWDLQQNSQGKHENFSDAGRILSMKMGIGLIRKYPVLGTGAGDLKAEMDSLYACKYPEIDANNRKLPHNQFIYTWASTGVLGIIALLMSIVFPLFYKKNYRDHLLVCFMLICCSSFLTEYTLEIQVGVAFYVTWLLVLLSYRKGLSS